MSKGMPALIVCGLDGVLSDNTERKKRLRSDEESLKEYYRSASEDKPNAPVLECIEQLKHRHPEFFLLVLSIRSKEYTDASMDWLINNGIEFDSVILRDYNASAIKSIASWKKSVIEECKRDFLERHGILVTIFIEDNKHTANKIRESKIAQVLRFDPVHQRFDRTCSTEKLYDDLAYKTAAGSPDLIEPQKPQQNSSSESSTSLFSELDALHENRSKAYDDNYIRHGAVVEGFFKGEVRLVTREDHVRFGLLTQIIGKLTRYCVNFQEGHLDSLDDLCVYARLLRKYDEENLT